MRARIIRLHHKTVEKLLRVKKEAEADGAYRVARRIHAVLLNHDALTSGDIALLLKTPRSRVSEWLKNYDQYGLEGLLEGQRSGRPAQLTADQKTLLSDIVESRPVAYGFPSGVWTSPMIARVMEDEFGVSYHPGHVRKLLYELGFSVQRPKRLLARADAAKQSRWRRYTYPRIKKKPKPRKRRSSTKTK